MNSLNLFRFGIAGFALIMTTVIASAASPRLRAHEKELLSLIDSRCGDTWCEGDFKFRFQNLRYNSAKKNILVDFQMALEIGHALAEPIELKGEISTAFVLGAQYPVQCLIPSEHSPQAILKGTHEVQNAFFDKMNECINSLEVRLRKPII